MNLKTTFRTAAMATLTVIGGSMVADNVFIPHRIAVAHADAFVIPSNLTGAARDSFISAQKAKIFNEDLLGQAVKAHTDTCSWCKTCEIVHKPDIILEQGAKLLKKIVRK